MENNQVSNPIEKIDKILEFILEQEQPPYTSFGEISNKFKDNFSSKEIIEILFELENDKYIFKEIRESDKIAYYYSTFKGRRFYLKGSYQAIELLNEYNKKMKEFEIKEAEARTEEAKIAMKMTLENQDINTFLNKEVVKIQNQMKKFQFWIVFATCIAGLYYIIQIIKLFFFHHTFYSQ